jgi:hypothetical protein
MVKGSDKMTLAALCSAVLFSTPTVLATPPANEETTAEGCIDVVNDLGEVVGSGEFTLKATFTLEGKLISGTFTYVDAASGISISSSAIWDYAYMDPNDRGFGFVLSGGPYSEAQLFVTDNGDTGDTLAIHLIDSSGVVYEQGGALKAECGGGVVISEPPPEEPPTEERPHDRRKGNNGVGNGIDPQPPGNPPINDGPGTGPGNPGNRGGARK